MAYRAPGMPINLERFYAFAHASDIMDPEQEGLSRVDMADLYFMADGIDPEELQDARELGLAMGELAVHNTM